jgi:hypothetical protein
MKQKFTKNTENHATVSEIAVKIIISITYSLFLINMDQLMWNYLDTPKLCKKQRKRLTLLEKKEVVQKYYNYLGDTDYAS